MMMMMISHSVIVVFICFCLYRLYLALCPKCYYRATLGLYASAVSAMLSSCVSPSVCNTPVLYQLTLTVFDLI